MADLSTAPSTFMPRFPHIIFDLDGTLIDSAPAILASFRDAFSAVSMTPAVPIAADIIGPPLTETLALLSASRDPALIARLADAFKASYDSSGYRHTTAFDGVTEMLQRLMQTGARLSIATNKRIYPTRLILEHLGWQDFFGDVYALDLFTPRLPDKAAMIGRLLGDRGIAAEQAIYIGDRAEDGQSADANHLTFIAASWGYGSLTAAETAAHWQMASTPGQLAQMLGA